MRYRVRFIRDAQVERAHSDKKRGGFWLEIIPVGTVKEVNEASLRFWYARGAVEIIEKLPERNPFELPIVDDPAPVVTRITKAEIRRQAVEASNALSLLTGPIDTAALLKHLEFLTIEDVLELLPEINSDSVVVLRAALADLQATGQMHVHPQELAEALADVEMQTRPPSMRRKK
jgi:hypothetical protein